MVWSLGVWGLGVWGLEVWGLGVLGLEVVGVRVRISQLSLLSSAAAGLICTFLDSFTQGNLPSVLPLLLLLALAGVLQVIGCQLPNFQTWHLRLCPGLAQVCRGRTDADAADAFRGYRVPSVLRQWLGEKRLRNVGLHELDHPCEITKSDKAVFGIMAPCLSLRPARRVAFFLSDLLSEANLKGLEAALRSCFGLGLETFVPRTRLLPGQPCVLDPPDIMQRGLLSAANA